MQLPQPFYPSQDNYQNNGVNSPGFSRKGENFSRLSQKSPEFIPTSSGHVFSASTATSYVSSNQAV